MELPDFASELWIMTASGLPLIHQSKCQDTNGDLFAGLVTAITHFAADIFTEQCKSIKMNSSKLTFLHTTGPDLIFLCKTTKNLHHTLKKTIEIVGILFVN